VEGTLGEAPDLIQVVESHADVDGLNVPDPARIVALTQTTLSVDESRERIEAIRKRFPKLTTPPKDDICYATQNRQDAVKALVAKGMDLLLVVGSKNSSNSQRLCEVARASGVEAHLIDGAGEIDPRWLSGKNTVGLTAGASAPEYLVEEVVHWLEARGSTTEDLDLIEECVSFALPPELSELETRT